jgi:hypothetical protein
MRVESKPAGLEIVMGGQNDVFPVDVVGVVVRQACDNTVRVLAPWLAFWLALWLKIVRSARACNSRRDGAWVVFGL